MSTRYFGERIKRNEDPRLLTGQALYVDDVDLPYMLHAAFLRSPYAHAKINNIDVSQTLRREGVVAVYTANDLGDYWKPGPLLVSPPPVKDILFNEKTQVPLAKNKVKFAGEPIVMVLAESRYIAEDALADIQVDYEPLEAVVDMEKALREDSPLIHEELGSNVAAHVVQTKGDGDFESIKKEAALTLKRRFHYEHGCAAALENRGIVAQWDRRAGRLTVWDTTQAPVFIRNGLAGMLGLSERNVRVIAPFIGGGFGPKIMMFYQEEVLVPWAAMKLNRPVKWIEDRAENFVATTHERGQIHDAEVAFDKDGRVLGVHDVFLHDTGAYAPYGLTVALNAQANVLGLYDIKNYYSEFTAVFTNKTIVTPYRGAGRQHGVFVIERMLDLAAKELKIDRAEIRRRNFIQPDQFPYNNAIIYQDFVPLIYDSGNYEPLLDEALERMDYHKFINEIQPKLRAEGKHVGIGIVAYVEGTGIGPYEGAKVQVMGSGRVSVVTGVGTQGQGHFTSYAQIVAEQLGVDVDQIDVVTGDTDQFYWGAGTFASRGAVVAGNAVNEAAKVVRTKILKLASEYFNAPEEELELADGEVKVQDIPRHVHLTGRTGEHGEPDARRGQAWGRAWFGGDGVFRSRKRRHGQWHPRHDHRSRSRDDADQDPKVSRRARLRGGHQSADPGWADPRRRGAGHRQCILRAARLRRERATAQRHVHGLSPAHQPGCAAHRNGARRNAFAAQPDGREGRGRGGRDPRRSTVCAGVGGCVVGCGF